MKKSSIVLLFCILFTNFSYSQTIEVEGDITENTIWSADTVKIIGNINVYEDVILKILPGTYVESQGFYHIQSSGSIIAIGTPNDSIYFSVVDTANFWADTTSNAGGWDGIHLENGSGSIARFEYCNMAYGKQYYSYPDFPQDTMGGGLIRTKSYGSLHIRNSLVHDNMLSFDYGVHTNEGGAIYCKSMDTVDIYQDVFKRNRSFNHGAAVFVDANCKSVIIRENTFLRNIAFFYYHSPHGWITMGGQGGAIFCTDAFNYSPLIYSNRCFNNSGGGIIYTSNLHSLIFNNVICNNGYIYLGTGIIDGHNLSNSKIFNNIVVNNHTNYGIDIFSKAEVYNNIVWNNIIEGEEIDNQIFINDMPLVDPVLFNNCVEYGPGGTDSIMELPKFANPTEGAGMEYDGLSADWTLLETSPCINTGTPDTTGLNLPEFDIAGNPRIFGGRIDMGAYENQSVYVKINDSPVYSEIKLYPNPGTDKIYIDIPPEINGSWLDIVDGQGKVLMHEQITFSPSVLSPYKLTAGIYFYRIYSDNEVIKNGKWIKR